jgi:hypothetical protein
MILDRLASPAAGSGRSPSADGLSRRRIEDAVEKLASTTPAGPVH